jgi:glycerol-3-phosphate dehydrogenase (NAD(P)+)
MSGFTIISDGGWGTALACVLGENGHAVNLWGPFPDVSEEIRATRINSRYLDGITIPDNVTPTNDLCEAINACDVAVFATPVVYLRAVAGQVAECLKTVSAPRFACVSKGIERETLRRGSQVIGDVLGLDDVGLMSGPSHAEEVARHQPTTVVAAAKDPRFAEAMQAAFMNEHFRVYTSDDPVGVETGAAVKNVIAIAAGICDGLGLGDNAKSALLTRGLAEITRLGMALGAKRETFAGLSGLGDLITTCVSPYGRNRRVGLEIGKGKSLEQVLDDMTPMVPEGPFTAQSVCALAEREQVEMPISQAVRAVLFEGKDPKEAVQELMTRNPKAE